ncbi:MAG: hypothetical protein K9J30_05420 [Bacteroidales bacterium]|nr:hypothetical protein [Bacteroidales bacterium]
MKRIITYGIYFFLAVLVFSCGVAGDPGHCYFALDWEYYNPGYGVYYYEDNNPSVPDSEEIVQNYYYDCYPGIYEYSYESEDSLNLYFYTGTYELIQNPGLPGGLFHDGVDGIDTYFKLYLKIYAKKGLKQDGETGKSISLASDNDLFKTLCSSRKINGMVPIVSEKRSWEQRQGDWILRFNEDVHTYRKYK